VFCVPVFYEKNNLKHHSVQGYSIFPVALDPQREASLHVFYSPAHVISRNQHTISINLKIE
jgi:hypothetical protein